MRDLQRLDPQVRVAVEELLRDQDGGLAMQQRLLESFERLEDLGQQSVGNEFQVDELVLLGNADRFLQCRDRTDRVLRFASSAASAPQVDIGRL